MKKVCFNPIIADAYSIEFAIMAELILKNLNEGDVFSVKQMASVLPFITKNRIKHTLSVMREEGFLSNVGRKDGGLYVFVGGDGINENHGVSARVLKEESQKYKTNAEDELLTLNGETTDVGIAREEKRYVSDEGRVFAEWFKGTLPDWVQKKISGQTIIEWARGYDELLSRGYSREDIRKASLYGRTDAFWSGNFFSPLKLLKKQQSSGMLYIDIFLNRAVSGRGRRAYRDVYDGVVL